MDSKDKYITLSIFFIGWLVLLISTSLPLFYINHTQAFSIDRITWEMSHGLLNSKCGSDNQVCRWLYGDYENAVYSGWFSFNFFILLLVVYPFFDVIRFLKISDYFFGQKGLKQFALSIILYNLYIFGIIFFGSKSFWINVSFGAGLTFYIVGLMLVYFSVFYGIWRSRLNRDSNYQ